MPPERYALIRNGALLWGPGPQPYFISLENGDLFEVTAHTPEEREAAGLLSVEQRSWREIDPEIEQAGAPAFAIEDGRPVETWSYSFTPDAREAMRRKVDEQAEALRRQYITSAPGQVMEYQAAFQEAQTVSALLIEDPISPGQFPFLEADLGVTELPGANRKVETVREAAAVVIGASDIWHAAGAQIRSRRLAAKSAISAAATDTEAYAAFISAWS